jgi:hypothetical protein
MNEEYLNLIQAEIDGLNSDSDSARMRSLIAEHPELRTAFEELKAVKLAIESLGEIEPPATLRVSIMNAIPERAMEHSNTSEKASLWAGIVSLVTSPKPVSLAYAFSLGLIVAFVATSVLIPPTTGSDIDQIAGTMGAVSLSGFETIASFAIQEEEEGEEEGSVKVHQSRDMIIIEFTYFRGRPIVANIEYDEEFLDLTATRSEGDSNNLETRTGDGELNFSGDGPLKEFVTLTVRDDYEGDDEMSFDVTSNGRTLLSRSIFIRK